MASSSSSPCAACKFLRRKCTQECVFAPYFPPEDPHKFSMVHKVFGASNVAKLLNELIPAQREDAVSSLAYEAITRLNDPVYGCVGIISVLQQQLRQIQTDIFSARKELSTYLGQSAFLPLSHPHSILHQPLPVGAASAGPALAPSAVTHAPFGMASNLMPNPVLQTQMLLPKQHQQQVVHHQNPQLAAAISARDQQEMLRNYDQQQQQQHQQELSNLRFNGNLDGTATRGRYNQINALTASASSLALVSIENPFPVQQIDADHHKPQPSPHHHHLSLQHQQQQHLRSTSDDNRSAGRSA